MTRRHLSLTGAVPRNVFEELLLSELMGSSYNSKPDASKKNVAQTVSLQKISRMFALSQADSLRHDQQTIFPQALRACEKSNTTIVVQASCLHFFNILGNNYRKNVAG